MTPPEADQPVYFKERGNAEEAEQINTDSAELHRSEELPRQDQLCFCGRIAPITIVYKIHPTSSTTNVIKSIYKVEGIFG